MLKIITAVAIISFVLSVTSCVLMVRNSQHVTIEPYHGVGSTVFQNGTLLQIPKGQDYSDPSQVVGTIKQPGVWVIRKTN